MGAHSPATLDVARQRVSAVRDQLSELADDTPWVARLDAALAAVPGGTLKAWMTQHHDQTVETLQTTIRVSHFGQPLNEPIGDWWTPGPRKVDAARATRVVLDGSDREYRGVTTFVATDSVYVGFAAWGADRVQMLVYSA